MATIQEIRFNILARLQDWSGLYDAIEVWRSRLTENGPYEEITAEEWAQARIPKTASGPPTPAQTGALVNIVGKELDLRVGEETDLAIIFTGSDPLTYAQVGTQITSQGRGLVMGYVDLNGHLTVQTTAVGTAAVLRVVGGDAAVLLALPTEEPDSLAFGRDARPLLQSDQESYPFADLFGSPDYFYRTRFRNRLSGATSDFSLPFSGKEIPTVSESNMVTGFLDLVTGEGRPVSGREVLIEGNFSGHSIEGKTIIETRLTGRTDDKGHLEFLLVRGEPVTVAVVGTNLTRQVTPPTDPAIASFNLLDPAFGDQDDYFKARQVNIPFAARRNL